MPRRRLLLVGVLLLSACGQAEQARPVAGSSPVASAVASPFPSAEPVPAPPQPRSALQPTATPPAQAPVPTWVVGASPLPLRRDGFGEVLPTPAILRDRAMTDPGLLPPPPDGAFRSSIAAISPETRGRMGRSWSPACPVGLEDLRYLTVSFRGFDGGAHTGELVVAASVAPDVVTVFRRLFAAGFPIESMRLIEDADLDAPPTGDGNNTAGYVCRAARGQTRWSQHAYGTAVDVNPFQNPQVKRDLVLPELASAYADRRDVRAGVHTSRGAAVQAFEAIGWKWGGAWNSSKDYMHFSQNGQ